MLPKDNSDTVQVSGKRNILGIILAFVVGFVLANLINRPTETVIFENFGKKVYTAHNNTTAAADIVSNINTANTIITNEHEKRRCKVVVFVPSMITSSDRRFFVNRQFVSENWSPSDVHMVWVIGTRAGVSLEQSLNASSVFAEPYMTHNNILLTNCRDSGDEYNNPNGTSSTTCKFYEAMRYINKHFQADYVIRGADDAYLNIKHFLKLAPEFGTSRLWLGQKRTSIGANPDLDLDNQPALKALFGFRYLSSKYMLGMGSIFSADVAELIGSWNIPPHLTWCEDVMVGMWLSLFNINLIDRKDLFINRAGSSGNMWPLDDTYGNITVILVHYMLSSDWNTIYNDEGGKIYLPCKGNHCP